MPTKPTHPVVNMTAALFASQNILLGYGQFGIESDTQKVKLGDGETAWNSLPYSGYVKDGQYLIVDLASIDADIAAVQADIDAHEALTNNPHGVTKSQVGLGNCDNTSDANKPVSTAQAAADALNLKIAQNLADLNSRVAARRNIGQVHDYQNGDSTITGTLTETILYTSAAITAGMMGANSVLDIVAFLAKTGTAGTATWKVYANTVANLTGATLIATSGSAFGASTRTMGFRQRVVNKNSTSANNWSSISSFTGDTPSTTARQTLNINWANTQYIMLTCTLGNTGDTGILDNIQLYILTP